MVIPTHQLIAHFALVKMLDEDNEQASDIVLAIRLKMKSRPALLPHSYSLHDILIEGEHFYHGISHRANAS